MTHISLTGIDRAHDERWHRAIDRMRSGALALVSRFSVDAPPYDALPRSMRDADFVPSAELNLALFFRYAGDGVEPSEQDTAPLVERAVRLVDDGMPIEEVLTNYRIGISFFWAQLIPNLGPDEFELIPDFGHRVTNYTSLVLVRITIALVEDARQPRWDMLERQSEIAADLLAGRNPEGWARDLDTPVADSFLIVVMRLGEPSPGTLTALRTRLAGLPGALLHRDSGGWTALVPPRPGDEADPVRALTSRLALRPADPHPQVWIGIAPAPTHAAIPEAWAEARIVAETARCLGRPEIVCGRTDMMFEYAIATAETALPSLAALLDPIDEQPLLTKTLDAYIDSQFNHNAVARALFIHRNTVTYRLSRITDLTGYDPQDPAGISTLMAARVARRLRAKSFRA
ncbi:PucR family transcriptional regulator [Nocardia jejuensis]|uniref:PucR family transcriptional regulator n=1 Tax=Nocardia jejuensis TaxID=328049 RepID=UPI00082B12CD|nr:helix-turn-helix domain-containing protein [Nocardia jejuensis]